MSEDNQIHWLRALFAMGLGVLMALLLNTAVIFAFHVPLPPWRAGVLALWLCGLVYVELLYREKVQERARRIQ